MRSGMIRSNCGFDYERLRITWELTRDIGLERGARSPGRQDIALALFQVHEGRTAASFSLREDDGTLHPRAARRRDGTEAPIQVSSTILNHVIKERAGVLTHDASMDFASSKGKSMILNRISSAMVVPLLHENEKEVLGVLWLDSESLSAVPAEATSRLLLRSRARPRCSSRTPSSRGRWSKRLSYATALRGSSRRMSLSS